MIEPIDDDEKAQLLAELVVERYGRPPKRSGAEEGPKVIARRRRVLLGLDAVRKR